MIALTALAIAGTAVPSGAWTALRTILVAPLALFLPGYALTGAIFRTRAPALAERIVLAFSLSLVTTALTSLFLYVTSLGLTVGSWITALALVTVAATLAVAAYPSPQKMVRREHPSSCATSTPALAPGDCPRRSRPHRRSRRARSNSALVSFRPRLHVAVAHARFGHVSAPSRGPERRAPQDAIRPPADARGTDDNAAPRPRPRPDMAGAASALSPGGRFALPSRSPECLPLRQSRHRGYDGPVMVT